MTLCRGAERSPLCRPATRFRPMKRPYHSWAAGLGVATVLLTVASPPLHAAVGTWAIDGKARIRLLAEGVDTNGQLNAGVEIALDPGWHTYWRSPGDSGIAPSFDFAGSRNLGPVEVAFPVPERLDDGYSVTNVYK